MPLLENRPKAGRTERSGRTQIIASVISRFMEPQDDIVKIPKQIRGFDSVEEYIWSVFKFGVSSLKPIEIKLSTVAGQGPVVKRHYDLPIDCFVEICEYLEEDDIRRMYKMNSNILAFFYVHPYFLKLLYTRILQRIAPCLFNTMPYKKYFGGWRVRDLRLNCERLILRMLIFPISSIFLTVF